MKSNRLVIFLFFLSCVTLVISVIAMVQSKKALQIALSEVVIEEKNSLFSPVFDEDSGTYGYIALFDVSIANLSGPVAILENVTKLTSGSGFIALLKGNDVVNSDVALNAFICEKSSNEIKANPGLLKNISSKDFGEKADIQMTINPGETKIIHVGLYLHPYSDDNKAIADMALVSFQFNFRRGKQYVFRRGFPIFSLQE